MVAHLATLIGDELLVVGWPLGFDLGSLGLGVTSVMALDLWTDPVVRTCMQQLVKLAGHVPQEGTDFILNKSALPVQITLDCALFTGMKVPLHNATFPRERSVPGCLLRCGNLAIVGKEDCGGVKECRDAFGTLKCGLRGGRPTA